MTVPVEQPADEPLKETEERLLDCALTLFAAQGYDGTSVREIIEAAGVTRPVLYYYCDNKEHLFRRVVSWTHDEAYRELERVLAETSGAANQLRVIIRGTFAYCANDPRIPQLMFQTSFGPVSELSKFLQEIAEKRFAMIVNVIQRGLDSNELQGGNGPTLALLFCSIMDYHANALSRLPAPEEKLTPELADALVDTFLYGVAAGRRRAVQLPAAL